MVIVSLVSMGVLGAALALFLAYAATKFVVEEDPRIDELAAILPGSNCGGCGFAGCRALAELILAGKAPTNVCVAGGASVSKGLAAFLGLEALAPIRMLAVVLCKGGFGEAPKASVYRGEQSCTAVNIVGGDKACTYGCLGYGECVEACKFDAMVMDDNGLPVVFYDKCVGCGACARACPRNIIEMHPENDKLFVYCRNKDRGAKAKEVCSVACIACSLCVKDCSVPGGIAMKDNLAVIDYARAPQTDESTKRCPTGCILFGVEEGVTKKAALSRSRSRAAV